MSHPDPTPTISTAPRTPLLVGAASMVAALTIAVLGTLAFDSDPATQPVPPRAAESPTSITRTDLVARITVASPFDDVAAVEIDTTRQPVAVLPTGPAVLGDLPVRPRSVLTAAELETLVAGQADTLDIYSSGQDIRPDAVSQRYKSMTKSILEATDRARRRRGILRSGQDTSSDPYADPTQGPFWASTRADLTGLPMLEGGDCIQSPEEAHRLRNVSRTVGATAARLGRAVNFESGNPNAASLYAANNILPMIQHEHAHADPSGLHQILQVTPPNARLALVARLSESAETEATKALVQRALFDLDADVRRAAVHALAQRSGESYEDQLLAGFDYPWPAAAEHAADALVAMQKTDVIEELRQIADEPDPRAPFRDAAGDWHARELVRVNHLRNCLMCHAPQIQPPSALFQVATGAVPDPYAPLAEVYYGGSGSQRIAVRADVTYLWQDFSVMHEVEQPQQGWPKQQRFDYFVRTNDLLESEVDALAARFPADNSPQRRAARYALRSLETMQLRRQRVERLLTSR